MVRKVCESLCLLLLLVLSFSSDDQALVSDTTTMTELNFYSTDKVERTVDRVLVDNVDYLCAPQCRSTTGNK
eukprot:c23371_g1_i3 orf=466-681(-)